MPTIPMHNYDKPMTETVISPLVLTTLTEREIWAAYIAAHFFGNQSAAAEEMGISRQRLNQWLNGTKADADWLKENAKRAGWIGLACRDILAKRVHELTSEVQG